MLTDFNLTVNSHQLRSIPKENWKKFNYPKLTVLEYSDRNGQNEIEQILAVVAPVGNTPVTLLYSTSCGRAWRNSVYDAVHTFNLDPVASWNSLIGPVLEEGIKQSIASRKEAKKVEKRYRKLLKKLNIDSTS